MTRFLSLANGASCPIDSIPRCPITEFRQALIQAVQADNCRVSAFFVHEDGTARELMAVLLAPADKSLRLLAAPVEHSYPALTPEVPAFHWFEREIHEEFGIVPEGHPWLKPIRFSKPTDKAGVTDYFTMRGEAVHEVAVGPVHAGVIEPGHFRFQCMGEDVYSLEIELGYQHRGVERLLAGGPSPRTLHLIETAAGDTSVAAAINACRILEGMAGIAVSPRAAAIRKLALELERIANHIGDLGALAGDVAFLPTSSFNGRIRGDFLNMTAALCGNRFGRGLVVPGGIRYDLSEQSAQELLQKVRQGEKELNHSLALMFDDPSVLDRFENTGTVSTDTAKAIGMVGVAARASGLPLDARADLSSQTFAPALGGDGDVLARAAVRRQELAASLDMVKELLAALPKGSACEAHPCAAALAAGNADRAELPPDTLGLHITEAWRGELCHVLITDHKGKIAQAKIVDPSFHNWFGLAMALRNQQISDFPICNKSFNLSYCGHDL